jgi:hypothetical protein
VTGWRWERGGVVVRATGGGLCVDAGDVALVVDAPRGVAEAVVDVLPRVHGVVVSSGRLASVRGLLGLLDALGPHRDDDAPLSVVAATGEERVGLLVEAWQKGWGRYPVLLDAVMPGEPVDVGDLTVTLSPLRRGEPDWRRSVVEPAAGFGVAVDVGGRRIVWVPAAAPDERVRRLCEGADLAVVEVGVIPWPRSDRALRPTLQDVAALTSGADEVWWVGDDGRALGPAAD